MKDVVDKRFVGLYTFLATVRNKEELSKEQCDELEGLIDGLFIELNPKKIRGNFNLKDKNWIRKQIEARERLIHETKLDYLKNMRILDAEKVRIHADDVFFDVLYLTLQDSHKRKHYFVAVVEKDNHLSTIHVSN